MNNEMQTKIGYIIKESGVTLFKGGKQYTAPNDFWSYSQILEKLKAKDFTDIENFFNTEDVFYSLYKKVENEIAKSGINGVELLNGEVYVDGQKIYNSISQRILNMAQQGFDIKPLSNFLCRLLKNPSKTAVNELYLFMEKTNQTIDEDGFIIAYKKVRNDYLDIHSSTVDYSIGNVVEMPRNEVDDNRSVTCSTGLHFCSFDYLKSFGAQVGDGSSRLLVVKVDPADVVSIPSDYNNAKARACKIYVIGELETEQHDVLKNSTVYPAVNEVETQIPTTLRDPQNKLKVSRSIFVDNSSFKQPIDAPNDENSLLKSSIEIFKNELLHRLNIECEIITNTELQALTLKDLTKIYNELVSVYNIINTVAIDSKISTIAQIKTSKSGAVAKIEQMSSKLFDLIFSN